MAKKTEPAKAGPQKECPKCHTMVHARKTTCDCGHTFEFKGKPPKTNKGKPVIDLETALPLVNEMGGVKALQTAIDAYRKAETTLKQIGGVENAEALHAKLELLRAVLGK
jgi:hypothetical protein